MSRWTEAFAPVSVGNGIVGFDTLGIAIQPLDGSLWGDSVAVCDSKRFVFEVQGTYQKELPTNLKSNLVPALAKRFAQILKKKGRSWRPIHLVLKKNLPVGSGLGGSGSSAVAAAFALNAHFDRPFSKEELLPLASYGERFATEDEPLDNVAPSLFGGVCLTKGSAENGIVSLPWNQNWIWVCVTPEIRIETRKSRRLLPKKVSLSKTVEYSRHLALFISALYRNDTELLKTCLEDVLIEPARGLGIPGFFRAKELAKKAGALGCGLSGSGPTTVALVARLNDAEKVRLAMLKGFRESGLNAQSRLARVDHQGARLLKTV